MQNFHSLRAWGSNEANSTEEPYFDSAQMIPPPVSLQSVDEIQLDPFAMVSLTKSTDPLQPVLTEQDILSGPLHDIPTTQSLISALQATIQSDEVRTPVVIPGARNRLPRTLNTDELMTPGKRLHPHLRLVLVLSAMMGILAYTLFSFTPLHAEQSGNSLVDGAVNWVVAQQQNWGLAAAVGYVQPTPTAVTTSTTSLVDTAAMTLPKSQYIEIAREDAIAAGISPDDFVRQINLESGFNPYAELPAGAEGIAQFEPATAAGLGIDPFNPTQALQGAAQYMARLSAQFGGSYAEAAAAYNAGSGAVQGAINEGGANWLSYLSAETQNYVTAIIA